MKGFVNKKDIPMPENPVKSEFGIPCVPEPVWEEEYEEKANPFDGLR
jgi:hypothetical protein